MTAHPRRQLPDVLELRIHGVNNTTPKAMLDLPQEAIEQAEGDDLGSFWRGRPDALEELTETDRGYVPPGIYREAYSWGGLARSSIGGTSVVGQLTNAAGRLGWSLLLPFGLVNVAYWSRRLAEGHGPDMRPLTYKHRGGAASLRLAGLLLTLLTAATASVLALDFLAVQCFAGGAASRCEGLPTWSGFLYGWTLSRRLALLSFAPLLLVTFLWYLSRRARTRYERASRDQMYGHDGSPAGNPDASRAQPTWPLLSTRGFWDHSSISGVTALLHLAAVALLLAIATAWHMRFGIGTACRQPLDLFGDACGAQVAAAGNLAGNLVLIVVYLALMLIVVALVLLRSEDAADIAGPELEALSGFYRSLRSPLLLRLVLVAAASAFVLQTVLLLVADTPANTPGPPLTAASARLHMAGVSAIPGLLIALLLAVCFSALTWRFLDARWSMLAAGVFAVALVTSGLGLSSPWPGITRGIAAVALLAMLLPIFFKDRGQDGPRRRYEMWGGCAPGVALLLAVVLCMTIASAFVVVVGNVLNGNYPAASLAGIDEPPAPQVSAGCDQQCDLPAAFVLTAPRPYVWFGAELVVVLAVLLLVLAAAALRIWLQARRLPPEPLVAARPAAPTPVTMRRGGMPSDPIADGGSLAQSVRSARTFARQAHRAEKVTALVAYTAAAGLLGALSVSLSGWERQDGLATQLMGWGMWVLTGVGVLVVGLAAGAKDKVGQRPLGLLWDLICFLPRAGHPFGPPCYAERVVPELLGRYRWWLIEEGARPDDQIVSSPRRIVVSAHSLGAVLAVATILGATSPTPDADVVRRISLLTYGVQLRAYFSRFFPELLGPEILGSQPCRAADGTSYDEWRTERRDRKPPLVVHPGSVRHRLGGSETWRGRWVNLWRATDYLGFPVHHQPGAGDAEQPPPQDTAFDRYAEEVDRTAYLLEVLTHGDYPRTLAYEQALRDLR